MLHMHVELHNVHVKLLVDIFLQLPQFYLIKLIHKADIEIKDILLIELGENVNDEK